MGYSTSNPPMKIGQGPIDNSQGGQLWLYNSVDAAATVAGAGYFTNGRDLGMQINDLIIVVDSATPLITTHRVKTIAAGNPGATTVSAGTTVGAT